MFASGQRSVVCFEHIFWWHTAIVHSNHKATRLWNRSAGRASSSPEHHVCFAAAIKTHRTPATDVVHSHPWRWHIYEHDMRVTWHGRPASPIWQVLQYIPRRQVFFGRNEMCSVYSQFNERSVDATKDSCGKGAERIGP